MPSRVLSFRECNLAEARLPRYRGRLLSGFRPEHHLKKAKNSTFGSCAALLLAPQYTCVEPQPAGESGGRRRHIWQQIGESSTPGVGRTPTGSSRPTRSATRSASSTARDRCPLTPRETRSIRGTWAPK